MPLENNAPAGSPGFSRNVATEIKAGKPEKQAVAIAYSKARGDEGNTEVTEQDAAKKKFTVYGTDRHTGDKKSLSFGTQAEAEQYVKEMKTLAPGYYSFEIRSDAESEPEMDADPHASIDAILDAADQLYARADSVARRDDAEFKEGDHPRANDGKFGSGGGGSSSGKTTVKHRQEAYDREQALLYQANAKKARAELESMPGYSGMSESEKTKHYKALEKKYDGERMRNYASGRRAAAARTDGDEEDCSEMDVAINASRMEGTEMDADEEDCDALMDSIATTVNQIELAKRHRKPTESLRVKLAVLEERLSEARSDANSSSGSEFTIQYVNSADKSETIRVRANSSSEAKDKAKRLLGKEIYRITSCEKTADPAQARANQFNRRNDAVAPTGYTEIWTENGLDQEIPLAEAKDDERRGRSDGADEKLMENLKKFGSDHDLRMAYEKANTEAEKTRLEKAMRVRGIGPNHRFDGADEPEEDCYGDASGQDKPREGMRYPDVKGPDGKYYVHGTEFRRIEGKIHAIDPNNRVRGDADGGAQAKIRSKIDEIREIEKSYGGGRAKRPPVGTPERSKCDKLEKEIEGLRKSGSRGDATDEPAIGSEAREEMPEDVFLEPGVRKYPVKKKRDGAWVLDRELLIAAAREARAHGHDELAEKADHMRTLKFGPPEGESKSDADPRDLASKGQIQFGRDYRPKAGDYVDYFSKKNPDEKKYGKVSKVDGNKITIDGETFTIVGP